MNPQVTLKHSWPELEIRETETPVSISKPIPRLGFEKKLRNAFFGKYSKFLTYLPYLGTDFTGGFGLQTFGEKLNSQKTFVSSKPDPGPIFVEEEWREEWEYYFEVSEQKRSSYEFELWGFFFLYIGDKENFQIWLQIQEENGVVSTPLKYFLTLLGWRSYEPKRDESLLSLLFSYQKGESKKADLDIIAKAVLYEGQWQFSGVLLDALSKGIWTGEKAISFWRFIIGFYEDWKDWEKSRFRNITIGKMPPQTSISLFKGRLSEEEKTEYRESLHKVFRGKARSENVSLNQEVQEFISRYRANRDIEREMVFESLKTFPYSYFYNLLDAIIASEEENWSRFEDSYEKAGRLRFLPVSLHYQAKFLQRQGEAELAQTLFRVSESVKQEE